ncbi:MAG: hypothetical protein HZA29_03045 [Candidatus Omnitrophica bacterium]|jgi:hypothetical protein|nr:hypothetical protein [Candidatus Omnitrophota bacterium]
MDARELTLNIAVNLGRLGRWALEGRHNRLRQFMAETEEYVNALERAPKTARFQKTFDAFQKTFAGSRDVSDFNETWAEEMFTWANILTHRAKLA